MDPYRSAKPNIFLDYNVIESGFYSRRVIDGYVAEVLNILPTKVNDNWDYGAEGVRWDDSENPNPTEIILAIEVGAASRSGKRFKRCIVENTFETVFIKIRNFNSSNPGCMSELQLIKDASQPMAKKRRIFASVCGGSEPYEDTRLFTFNNKKLNLPFFVIYTEPEEVFADYHHEMIKKLKTDNHNPERDPNSGLMNTCLDQEYPKCSSWRSGSILFAPMTFPKWEQIIKCEFTTDFNQCQNLTADFTSTDYPYHFPPKISEQFTLDVPGCCDLIPHTEPTP